MQQPMSLAGGLNQGQIQWLETSVFVIRLVWPNNNDFDSISTFINKCYDAFVKKFPVARMLPCLTSINSLAKIVVKEKEYLRIELAHVTYNRSIQDQVKAERIDVMQSQGVSQDDFELAELDLQLKIQIHHIWGWRHETKDDMGDEEDQEQGE
ncbi:hypothetical protein VKT23_019863 [Stygiomarasmius scandens]|uniref:Uncharacterized protein n=1 Tax=Marasmiellus scandens TaxID=2682957 RepID=A0ABR1ILR8_9AGAR